MHDSLSWSLIDFLHTTTDAPCARDSRRKCGGIGCVSDEQWRPITTEVFHQSCHWSQQRPNNEPKLTRIPSSSLKHANVRSCGVELAEKSVLFCTLLLCIPPLFSSSSLYYCIIYCVVCECCESSLRKAAINFVNRIKPVCM
jgi:hypothetical protein